MAAVSFYAPVRRWHGAARWMREPFSLSDIAPTTGTTEAPFGFKVDVRESADALVFTADLPGVSKDAIEIDVKDQVLTMRAEIKREDAHPQGERLLRHERLSGRFVRQFVLESPVDEERAVATFNNGVLELTLPKKAVVSAKRISVV